MEEAIVRIDGKYHLVEGVKESNSFKFAKQVAGRSSMSYHDIYRKSTSGLWRGYYDSIFITIFRKNGKFYIKNARRERSLLEGSEITLDAIRIDHHFPNALN